MASSAVLAAAMVATSASTGADAVKPGHYELNWVIASHALPPEPFWVKKIGKIVETRLLPVDLFQSSNPITDSAGRMLAVTGSQFARLQSDKLIACTIGKSGALPGKSERLCLIDQNNDGAFDGAFTRGGGSYYWFELSGKIPEVVMPLAPLTLAKVDPASMRNTPVLVVTYQRILDRKLTLPLAQERGDFVRFHFEVGTASRREWMTRECTSPAWPSYCASSMVPSTFEFLGLKVNILERNGNDIRAHVVAPFTPGPRIKLFDVNDGYTSGELLVVDQPTTAQ
jgi:hypothetical protein